MKRFPRNFLFLILIIVFPLAAPAAPDCTRPAGSLPDPTRPAGAADPANPIQHIVVIVQENHSFDNYFGMLRDPHFYGNEVDGIQPSFSNKDAQGNIFPVHKSADLCISDPHHGWNSVHLDWNQGFLDGFVKTNDDGGQGSRVMGYFDSGDLPFYYALANQFAIGDRYFSSVMTMTFPNRFYLYAGTSFGHIQNDFPGAKDKFTQKTIFDLLDQYGISWKYYSDDAGYLKLFQPMYLRDRSKMKKIADYEVDLANGTLPAVSFLDTWADGADEHPDADVQVGQAWTAQRIEALMHSSAWASAALFLTYDENGGFFDHVAPPEACAPDYTLPMLDKDSQPGDFAHLGFRVPFVAVSPFAKHHFVSHTVFDHGSILKFIEKKFNLPALTMRDANADGFSDVFDFAHPVFTVNPLAPALVDPNRVCNLAPVMNLPRQAVALQSEQDGICLGLPAKPVAVGTALVHEKCDASDFQKFFLREDGFGTYKLQSAAEPYCLQIDWVTNQLLTAACSEEEDQGFDLSLGDDGKAFNFSGWAGDFCLVAGAEGTTALLSSCVDDGRIDFNLK